MYRCSGKQSQLRPGFWSPLHSVRHLIEVTFKWFLYLAVQESCLVNWIFSAVAQTSWEVKSHPFCALPEFMTTESVSISNGCCFTPQCFMSAFNAAIDNCNRIHPRRECSHNKNLKLVTVFEIRLQMENERVLRLLLRKFGRTSKKVLIKAGRSVKLLWEIRKKFDNTVGYSNYHVVI